MSKKDGIDGTPCKVFFFDTNFGGFLDEAQVLDGHIFYEFGDKKYEFTASQPITFMEKSFMSKSLSPLYFCKWDEITPTNFELEETTHNVPLAAVKTDTVLSKLKISNMLKKAKKSIKKSKNNEIPSVETKDQTFNYKRRSVVTVPIAFDMKFSGATKIKNQVITPEMLRSTLDMRFIKSMKDASLMGMKKRKLSNIVMVALLGGVIIAFVLYGMYSSGLLKI